MSDFVYKMRPVGNEGQPQKRAYEEPRSELKQVFEKWMEGYEEDRKEIFPTFRYDKAVRLLQGLDCNVGEIHGLLVAYKDNPNCRDAGLFMSAAYNVAKEKTIVYDLDHMIGVGHKLSQGKILVNRSNSACELGSGSLGTVINLGRCTDIASLADCLAINFGHCNSVLGKSAGCLINFGEIDRVYTTSPLMIVNVGKVDYINFHRFWLPYPGTNFLYSTDKHVSADSCTRIPELAKYVAELEVALRPVKENHLLAQESVEKLGDYPGTRVRKRIETILREAGRNV